MSPLTLPGTATREAAQWHALHRERPLSAEEHTRFLDWMTASPEHLREYLAVSQIAGELGGALQAMDIDVDALLASPAPTRSNVVVLPRRQGTPRVARRGAWWRRAAVAASLALVTVTAGWLCWPRTYTYTTAHAEQRRVTLPDHSTVHLNAESQLRVRFSLLRRDATLLRGQATFEVATDRRPFEVLAGTLRVQDIGTTFDVALQREQVRVGVSEGQVRVSPLANAARTLADLHAGQSARIDYQGRHVSLARENVETMTAWWQRRVVFRDDPLADVADQFNRLNRTRVVIEDPQAAALRLTGNLHSEDIASLRVFLQQQRGLQVVQAQDEIRVRTRPR
ncbi:FecR domain-containing protein [Stenotrophomonas sp. 24(2023)]|uniref:FecR family protein n=1 Tax=Stenotrophomonas sp. 24(2023) TaxID=3068324 RepID=UPI0027DED4E7|nr:FecR domain-containing protein [Stenotrophomonas sp. 24(2023)]WMJ69248.1 FecR domain-containing protein [Stenotrophomonas sp. 24(2023)]